MPVETSMQSPTRSAEQRDEAVVLDGELRCSLSGRPLKAEEAYWAPPLVTVKDLLSVTLRTLVQTPGALGTILTAEQPNVPYAPEMRQELARRRSAEQIKLLGVLLLVAAILIVPIVLLTS